MKRQTFLQGALILMIAGLINRVMGFILRLILVRVVGDEGLGLFQMVFPLFITLLLLSTAGFPVAISKLIPERLAAGDRKGGSNLLRVSLVSAFLMSIIITALLYTSSRFIAVEIYGDERLQLILRALIPALIFSPLAASFRGYFQGMHTMIPTAASQIIEQLFRITATLIIISLTGHLSLELQAAGIALGLSAGELSGLLILLTFFSYHYSREDGENSRNNLQRKKTAKRGRPAGGKSRCGWFLSDFKVITALAVPITLGRLVNSLMLSGEAVLIPRQLQLSGLTLSQSAALYGQLSGMVEQLLYLPTVITTALTISLIPSISEASARNNLQRVNNNYQDVIRVTSYLGFPVAVIFYLMGPEICRLLFGYPQAGYLLATMSFSAPFIYYLQVSSGMLNGLGKPQLPLINSSLGSLLKLCGIFFLTRQPELGIQGAALSIGAGYLLSAFLNFISVGKRIGFKLNIKQCLLKPLLSSGFIYLLYPRITAFFQGGYLLFNPRFESLIILLLLIMLYLFMMILTGAVTPADLRRFKRDG